LADLHAQFGDWYLAMAAYNCGPGCAQRAVERTGYADYWELVERRALPRETSNYVPAILAMALLAKNAGAFQLHDVVPEDPIDYDTVVTESRIGLKLIADVTGATPVLIKQLNPALLGEATPDGRYALRIPKETAEQFHSEIATIPEVRRMSWRRHEVQSNESLTTIAALYKVRPQDIALVNGLCPDAPLAGDRLTIPVPYKPESPSRSRRAAVGSSSQHKVRSGETLGTIAARYRVTVSQLQQWNGLRGTRLVIGQVLRVSSATVPVRAKSKPTPARRQLASSRLAPRQSAAGRPAAN